MYLFQMIKGRIWRLLTYSMLIYILCFLYFLVFPTYSENKATVSSEDLQKHDVVDNVRQQNDIEHDNAGRQVGNENKPFSLEPFMTKGVLGNYEPKEENKRSGPGEYGQGVKLTGEDIERGKESVAEYGFNEVASEKISLDRQARDTRYEKNEKRRHLKKRKFII